MASHDLVFALDRVTEARQRLVDVHREAAERYLLKARLFEGLAADYDRRRARRGSEADALRADDLRAAASRSRAAAEAENEKAAALR
jgi:hypothetical protein